MSGLDPVMASGAAASAADVAGADIPVKKRILQVIETLGPGGAEHQLQFLLPALAERGYLSEVAAISPPYTVAAALEARGFTVHRLNVHDPRNLLLSSLRLRRLLRAQRYDIIHAHLSLAMNATAIAIRGMSQRPRTVATFHNAAYQQYPAVRLTRKLRRAVEGAMMRRFDALIGVSDFVSAMNQRTFAAGAVQTIFNAIPGSVGERTPEQRQAVTTVTGFAADDFYLLTVGRLVPSKAHEMLVDVIRKLRDRGVPASLAIVGTGECRDAIARRADELGVSQQVKLLGVVENHHLRELLLGVDVFVFPTRFEAFGMAAAEAMMSGLPVVASRVGGVVELMEDGISGRLAPPGDAESWAGIIAELHADAQQRERLGAQAQARAQKLFNIASAADQVGAVYEGLSTP